MGFQNEGFTTCSVRGRGTLHCTGLQAKARIFVRGVLGSRGTVFVNLKIDQVGGAEVVVAVEGVECVRGGGMGWEVLFPFLLSLITLYS